MARRSGGFGGSGGGQPDLRKLMQNLLQSGGSGSYGGGSSNGRPNISVGALVVPLLGVATVYAASQSYFNGELA